MTEDQIKSISCVKVMSNEDVLSPGEDVGDAIRIETPVSEVSPSGSLPEVWETAKEEEVSTTVMDLLDRAMMYGKEESRMLWKDGARQVSLESKSVLSLAKSGSLADLVFHDAGGSLMRDPPEKYVGDRNVLLYYGHRPLKRDRKDDCPENWGTVQKRCKKDGNTALKVTGDPPEDFQEALSLEVWILREWLEPLGCWDCFRLQRL